MKEREEKDKSNLTIRLAESVIYLKDVDFSGRHYTHNELSPPSMVRGVLVLHLSKPTKICSIGIELTAKSATRWPEGAGSRRVEVTEEHQLYSSSTIYFRQEAEEHHSRRAISLGPASSRETVEEDYTSSSDLEADNGDNENSHAQRRAHDLLRGRRGASLDLHNFHRDIVSHHATTHIPTPSYIPSAENTPEGSPTSSAASLSPTHYTPPPDQGSPSRTNPLSRVQSDSNPVQRDHRFTISGTSSLSTPPPQASRRRISHVVEDFRRALGSDLNTPSSRTTPLLTDNSTLASPVLSPTLHTPSSETPDLFAASRGPVEFDDGTRGRKRRNRFSLHAISDAILDRVRSRSPMARKRGAEGTPIGSDAHGGEKTGEVIRGRSREAGEKGKGMSRDLSHALIKVSEVFGLEPEEGREPRDRWKEFKKGTYRYPISFAIPADSPPSLDSMFGSIVWTLTATVHRPGRFTPRMETVRTINVVATPSEDATEDVESVTVNKTWEDQMVYCLSIVGRAFPIGTKVPIQLTLLPMAKIKIYKVSVAIDEKVMYYSEMQKVAKVPKSTRQVLYCLKDSDKSRTPILPLTETDPHKSPLYALAREDLEYTGQSEEERAVELAAEWMGPGPWPLRFNVEIFNTYGALRPTNMNKKGNITVSHTLMITIRVEKTPAGEGGGDGSKKKKMYDIIIQYPIHLLSHLCNQKYTSLPAYSPTWHSALESPGESSSSKPGPSSIVREVLTAEHDAPTPEYVAPTDPTQRITLEEREQLTLQFERLVTGQEAETGEPPPCYQATAPPVHAGRHHALHA
ncbi:hypothetical protein BJ322DRAFT_1176291 [Thelephora terrestris]|uniref:Arrestin C-terminal-like domain-containing protein n=1 Tax=Thelephora terrestris TaxID=56493 RepID=A0A9P6L1C8_9AGAM|nr:hypothetical protein BJ322DRAFT_1176291 [Thelephora terrestris]